MDILNSVSFERICEQFIFCATLEENKTGLSTLMYKDILYIEGFMNKVQFPQEFQPCFLSTICQMGTAPWKPHCGGDKDILLPTVQKKGTNCTLSTIPNSTILRHTIASPQIPNCHIEKSSFNKASMILTIICRTS
ncbi:hypothetical protein QQP08_002260 [Theobroma cacao]|nr:hypothetical protein QQP08_002260 [Theobroma cacao]